MGKQTSTLKPLNLRMLLLPKPSFELLKQDSGCFDKESFTCGDGFLFTGDQIKDYVREGFAAIGVADDIIK